MIALITAGSPASAAPSPTQAGNLERAAALVRAREFEQAATMLRQVLSADPGNRAAQEMLAFALESSGDLEGERQVRSELAAAWPDDPRIQADLGRVLERSEDDGGALRAYRRARELRRGQSDPELDAAIERMSERTATEVGMPLVALISEPDARASRVQAGVALPLGSRDRLTILATRGAATSRTIAGTSVPSAAVALTLVVPGPAGGYWSLGPRVHAVSTAGDPRGDVAAGGAIAQRMSVSPWLGAAWGAELNSPWDEAAVAMLHGGRTSGAEAHLYVYGFSQRLLVQAGARRRQLSILAADRGGALRTTAWQSLGLAGADVVVWRKPGDALRGEMLDEALIAPTSLSSALTVAYRHYEVSSETPSAFGALIALAPRGSVDEVSLAASLAAPQRDLGLELNAGLSRDAVRAAQDWRAGGAMIWALSSRARLALRYDEVTEVAIGLSGQRRAGGLSLHVDL